MVVVVVSLGSRDWAVMAWPVHTRCVSAIAALIVLMTETSTAAGLPILAGYVTDSSAFGSGRWASSLMVLSGIASVELVRFGEDGDIAGSCGEGVGEEVRVV